MLTDPGHIGKIRSAIQKLEDATIKACDVRIDFTAPSDAVTIIIQAINLIAHAKMTLSETIPPDP